MYTLPPLYIRFSILYDYFYNFVMNILFEYGECKLTKISHHFQSLLLFYIQGVLYLSNDTLRGIMNTIIRIMNSYSKLFRTHYLYLVLGLKFCSIIFISLLWIYDLKTESVNLPKYITTSEPCDFIISKGFCIWHTII